MIHFLCSELRMNLIWNLFKYLNSADEYIVSEDRNSVSRYILSYVVLYEFVLEKDS